MESVQAVSVEGIVLGAIAPVNPVFPAKTRKPRVDMQQFVTAWEGSNSVKEVADKTGLEENSVQARASKYRSQGIPLKEMQRGGGAKLNVGEATELLAKLRGVSTDVIQSEADEAAVARAERKAKRDAAEAAEKAGQTAPAA